MEHIQGDRAPELSTVSSRRERTEGNDSALGVPGAESLLELQRTAGNAATTLFVQRHTGATQFPSSAQVGKGATAANAADRQKNVEGILDDSDEGKVAKKIATDNSVSINWAGTAGGGSYFQAPKSVTFDKNLSDEDTTLAYVHEMNHAQASASGKSAQTTLPRDEYIKQTFTEETEGTVLAILAERHTDEKAVQDWSGPKDRDWTDPTDMPAKMTAKFAFQDEYWKAHDDTIAALPKETSKEEKEKQGRAAGTKKIFGGFMDGTIKTSMPGNPSYVTWYGNIWDAANTPPAPAGGSTPSPGTATTSGGSETSSVASADKVAVAT